MPDSALPPAAARPPKRTIWMPLVRPDSYDPEEMTRIMVELRDARRKRQAEERRAEERAAHAPAAVGDGDCRAEG